MKKPKPWYKRWWIWLLIIFAVGSVENAINPPKESTSTTSTAPAKLSQKDKAATLKLGTSKSSVLKIVGKPVSDEDQMLTYHGFDLYFEADKLVGGSIPAIQKQVDQKIAKEKEAKKNKQSQLQSHAEYFGNKPVASLQKNTAAYKGFRVGDDMVYNFKFADDEPTLIRVDSADGLTTVYEADKNAADGRGKELYTGKTIINKQPSWYNSTAYQYY